MMYGVYMLFDNCSQSYVGAMTLIKNDAVAIRSFKDLLVSDNPNFPYKNMASDINLMKIGEFNVESGDFVSKKELICNLGNLLDEMVKGKVVNGK